MSKQETLKEVAKEYAENEIKDRGTDDDKLICSIDFIAGAKWQQEQDKKRYSEEDMIKAIYFGAGGMYGYQIGEEGYDINQIKRFLETFKNK